MVYGRGYSVCEPASVPFPVLKTLQQNLVSATKIHHITSGFKVRVQVVILSTRLIIDDWIGMDQSCSSEPIRGEGKGDGLEPCTKSVHCLYLIVPMQNITMGAL